MVIIAMFTKFNVLSSFLIVFFYLNASWQCIVIKSKMYLHV